MANTNKDKAKDPKPINDVAKPGEKTPSDTSRAIITHRPMMQDPMVVDPDNGSEIEANKPTPSGGEKIIATSNEAKDVELKSDDTVADLAIKAKAKKDEEAEKAAITEQKPETTEDTDETKPEDKTENKTDNKANDSESTDEKPKSDEPEIDAEATKKAEHDANVKKLIESKKFELPITTSEKRRSTRFVILGIILAIILGLAWLNIALDAGLIEVSGVKPVTNLFAN